MPRQAHYLVPVMFVIVILVCLAVALQPLEYHLKSMTFVDDGFYYMGYAKNLAAGNGPTFDGLVYTNGVQPLWAVLTSLIAVFVKGELALMQATLVFSVFLAGCSFGLMRAVLKHFFTGRILLIATLFHLALISTPRLFLNGMESPVILFTFTLSLWAILNIRTVNYGKIFLAGIALSLVILSRIDLLIMTPTFALLLIWSNGTLKARQWRTATLSVVTLAIPCVIVFGAYIVFNLMTFGLPLPISGMIKTAWYANTLESAGGRFTPQHILMISKEVFTQIGIIINYYLAALLLLISQITLLARAVFVIGIIGFAIKIFTKRKLIIASVGNSVKSGNHLNHMVFGLVFLNLYFHTWMQYFVTGPAHAAVLSWYYVNWYVMLTIVIGLLLKWIEAIFGNRLIDIILGWVIISFIISIGLTIRTFHYVEGVQPYLTHYDAVVWANENIPDDEIIGSFNSGVVGYFTDNTVINLDGLMNDTEILELTREDALFMDYVKKHNITWFMDYKQERSSPLGKIFRRLYVSALDFHYEKSFYNFDFADSTFYVAQINLSPVSGTSP